MTKNNKYEWIAPAFLVVGIFAVYLSLLYLPLDMWGITNFPTAQLWLYMPWLIALAVGICVLKELWRRN